MRFSHRMTTLLVSVLVLNGAQLSLQQYSSVGSYVNNTHYTAAVQAGACRLFVLLLSSLSSLDRLHTVTYLVGSVWDHRGHYILLTPVPPGDAAATASSGVLENLPYFHVAHPIGDPVRRVALWLYSGFDLSMRYVQGWKPNRKAPSLSPPPANFVGRRLKFVSFEHEPSNIYLDHKLGGDHVGMDYWLARALADVYNFTLDMREPTDGGKWGEALPNGTWIGLVGDVKERRAHFGIANIFLTLSRWKHVDYTRPYDHEHACFAVWNKPPLPHWLAVVRPFSWPAWLTILTSLTLSVAVMVVLARLAGGERAAFTSLPRAAMYNFGVLLARTHLIEPRRAPSRSFDIGWRLAAMVLGFAYCAKLISFLTFPTVPEPIDSHRELAETGVEVGSWGGTLGELMAASTNPWDRQLATRYIPNYDFDNALRRVFAQEYGYIENRNTLIYYIQKYYTTKTGQKQLHIMDECFQNFMISVMLPKYSMLTDLFSRTILRVREAGLIPIWFSWSLDAVKTELVDIARGSSSDSRRRSLSLEHMQGVFLLLLLGWVLSLLSFLAEFGVRKVGTGRTTPPPAPTPPVETAVPTERGEVLLLSM
ncbi:ionotropic receptor 21a-like [Amphibalanus amphitrite]|uniref:ionotropic receptor 21a-like n=1 Tax=Amphibalanus amphitrite TaxID=1232801 RepID=UPI001C928BD7|nr:ionotropic receptor 21a-like [Amphibalanus amphitrite]